VGGGRDSDEGNVVGEGWSGGGGDRPRMASSMSSGSLRQESQAVFEHTHRIRAIQAINNRVVNTITKMVGALATKTMGVGVSITNILLMKTIEWGCKDGMNK
jgi:hypothetical protein